MDRRTVLGTLGALAVPSLAGCATYDRASDRFDRLASGGILAESYDATSGVYGGLTNEDELSEDDNNARIATSLDDLSDYTFIGKTKAFVEETDFSRTLLIVVQFVDREDATFSVGVVRRIGDGVFRVGISRQSGTSSVKMVHTLLGRLEFTDAAALERARRFSVYYRGSEFVLSNPRSA